MGEFFEPNLQGAMIERRSKDCQLLQRPDTELSLEPALQSSALGGGSLRSLKTQPISDSRESEYAPRRPGFTRFLGPGDGHTPPLTRK